MPPGSLKGFKSYRGVGRHDLPRGRARGQRIPGESQFREVVSLLGARSEAAVRTEEQVSAGGVVVRGTGDRAEVVLVSVGPQRRWQLPKGLVEPGEAPEAAAVREVREEAGGAADLLAPIQ